jgi:glucose-1-phosphate cytidylyltransferase
MKVAILAGGAGTRLLEETMFKPKPLVEIGGKPILWHIMMYYSCYGFSEFVIAIGYKAECIKRWMQECSVSDMNATIKAGTTGVIFHDACRQNWIVHLIDTGQKTLTGGRIKRLAPWLGDETFMLTWCDSVANVDLDALLKFHHSHGRLATVTAVHPPSRFGHLELEGDKVVQFAEKPLASAEWINGAFFVLEPGVFNYIKGDNTQWEKEPLESLSRDGQLMAYRHTGFWQCMDTLHEKLLLEKLWQRDRAPWKIWKE